MLEARHPREVEAQLPHARAQLRVAEHPYPEEQVAAGGLVDEEVEGAVVRLEALRLPVERMRDAGFEAREIAARDGASQRPDLLRRRHRDLDLRPRRDLGVGNITVMPHLSALDWDYADQMRHVDVNGSDDVYFNYDATGQRVRKVWITNSGTWRRERIYLGGYEIWRKYNLVSGNWVLQDERETVHVSDDQRRICIVESLTWDAGTEIADIDVVPRYRFQFDNHLGTACVETDETGAVISYEEYHPYGTSSYRSWKSGAEVSAKRYRYTGKERDEETSLYYHGARYYAPWLGRWMSADPAGTVDGTNLFAYVRGSPMVMSDPSGMAGSDEPRIPQTGIYSVGYEGHAEPEASSEYDFAPAEISGSYSQAVQRQAWLDRISGKTDQDQQQERAAEQAEVEEIAETLARRGLAKSLTEDPKIRAKEALGGLEPGHVAAVGGAPAALALVAVGVGEIGGLVAALVPSWVWGGAAVGTLATQASSHEGPGAAAHFEAALLFSGRFGAGEATSSGAVSQAGAGGKWKTVDELPGGAVAQQNKVSCGAACGEMVSGARQVDIIAAAGAPTDVGSLATALGSEWQGGYVGPPFLDDLFNLADPWIAEFYEGGRLGHHVVIDGLDDVGRVIVRDPWAGGSTYKMALDEFKRVWNGNAVFRQ